MEKIVFDIPMKKFLQEYFEKRLVYDITTGRYPSSNPIYNSMNVYRWITDIQTTRFDGFLFSQTVHQANNKVVHFEVSIFDSERKEHKFRIWMDIQQTVRKVKLNEIKSNIDTL